MHGKVTVTVSQKKLLRAARRTGWLAVLWPSAYNPACHHAYAQPAAYYQYQAKPAAAHAHAQHQHQHQYYGCKNSVSVVARKPMAQFPQAKASSYNYHVHGYYDSDLYGSYHEQPNVVPVAVRSYFSDENPSACSIM
ncbi:heavy metal-associated isoprenylated plant protein 28-like [Phragmites australis]|uniref:heavy metal-associated isoprenylated plant protein 28-like n=1 Tax=Phragmites australis TaxID=29695 RepID=UPI002D7775A7|nr:heavy metal-associated isoprenylated plant protein 28-like [Phragmites australis]